MIDLSQCRRAADRAQAARAQATRTADVTARDRDGAAAHYAAALRARTVVQSAASAAQQAASGSVAAVVTTCLRAVFGDAAYGFRIEMAEKRGRTEAELYLTRDGADFDPLSAAGGGVVSVVAFALRLADVVLGRPAKRRLIVADEPFANLSRGYAAAVAALLERLAAELDLQIVLVTHTPALACGKVIDLGVGGHVPPRNALLTRGPISCSNIGVRVRHDGTSAAL